MLTTSHIHVNILNQTGSNYAFNLSRFIYKFKVPFPTDFEDVCWSIVSGCLDLFPVCVIASYRFSLYYVGLKHKCCGTATLLPIPLFHRCDGTILW